MNEQDNRDELLPEHEPADKIDLRTIWLTREETLFVDDMLVVPVPMVITEPSDLPGQFTFRMSRRLASRSGIYAGQDLVKKIAIAVLFATDPENHGDEVSVRLECHELLLLRDLAQSDITFDQETVGYNLKLKIYKALYGNEYHTHRTADRLLSQIEPSALISSTDEVK